jgi:hypothetical protein
VENINDIVQEIALGKLIGRSPAASIDVSILYYKKHEKIRANMRRAREQEELYTEIPMPTSRKISYIHTGKTYIEDGGKYHTANNVLPDYIKRRVEVRYDPRTMRRINKLPGVP